MGANTRLPSWRGCLQGTLWGRSPVTKASGSVVQASRRSLGGWLAESSLPFVSALTATSLWLSG